MAKCLTREMYAQLRDRATPSGFTLDNVIQTGVDNPGHPFIMTVGAVAGDEETYEVFKVSPDVEGIVGTSEAILELSSVNYKRMNERNSWQEGRLQQSVQQTFSCAVASL